MPDGALKAKPPDVPHAAQADGSPGATLDAITPGDADEVVQGMPDTLGEEIEARDRNPDRERSGRDVLDDARQMSADDQELPLDAVDEAAGSPSLFDYETRDTGVRRPRRDDAEMGEMSESHSAEELERNTLGDALPGRPGVRRDGEEHGERFLDRP